ncbi:MAG: ribonuclease Z [Solirubrobacterales bacterium]
MDLSVAFLGTGGSVPTARRATASVLVARGGERLMFDCGEGTQRQMQRSLGLVQVDAIFLTHFHADHFLGLPGLLKTYDLTDRARPLTVYGPAGLRELFAALRPLLGRNRFEIDLIELGPGDAVPGDGYEIRAFGVEHRTRACGYALTEEERPGRLDAEEARRLGIPFGPDFGRLQRGESVTGSQGTVAPEQVMGEPRPGRTVAITGDTAPCHATAEAARGASLLVHDASFAEEEAQRAAETGHSTAGQAAALAREAGVAMLALVHISSRYHVGAILEEAREEFANCVAPRDFDLVEIPFPERGEPVLVPNGARGREAGVREAKGGGEGEDEGRAVMEPESGGETEAEGGGEGEDEGRAVMEPESGGETESEGGGETEAEGGGEMEPGVREDSSPGS